MGLKDRLEKVEARAANLYDEVTLPDGRTVRVGPLDRFHSLVSLLEDDEERKKGELHWLARAVQEADTGADLNKVSDDDFVKIVLMVGRGSASEEGQAERE